MSMVVVWYVNALTSKLTLIDQCCTNLISRYAPATQIWRGRLHVMGGGKENRHTPSTDHWSIAVKNGNALEKTWRKEVPIPRGGPHR